MSLALEYEPRLKGCFAWNDFRHCAEVLRKTPWCQPDWWETSCLTPVGHRALRDGDIVGLGNYLVHAYDFGACAPQSSRLAINAEAEHHIFDELKDHVSDFPDWDGVARADSWLATYAGADTEAHTVEYLALAGSKYLMQVLHRALNPGSKADYSLVFTCLQGIGKDRILEAMFAPYYREGIPSPRISQADFALAIAGAMVAHAAEMSAWRKAEVEEQKAALTRCVDHGRRAYGYEPRSYPRRTCLAFSTNDDDFLQDATGDRRYWGVTIVRGRVDIEGLRRDRDQILAEALHRLKAGEQHWPTPEEEERLIVPERHKHMPEMALEIIAVLQRFIVEEPLTPRPNRGDFAWKWQRRTQPLRELYLDAFFGRCFGMYAAVRRQGLERASKRDISYCTTWLRGNDWRHVQKRLPDGQTVRVWRAPNWKLDQPGGSDFGDELGCELTERASPDPLAGDVAGSVADSVAGQIAPTNTQARTQKTFKNRSKPIPNQSLTTTNTQDDFCETIEQSKSPTADQKNFTFLVALGKARLGVSALDGLLPATLDELEERFPRDRFLALDVETTGLTATTRWLAHGAVRGR